ncbi:bifunctional transaldolase/phosoglucose isomerase [uncultured Thermanaerothrix sp.]|uniref:bifunctional transaldolase/phosoglucose isomerase n=1 Tax=uncultured Thermanaerothrix sp. TaxID=1195149 RepID=UPI0026037C62|nr:bifunctional transaldolase/phosoglucose isomerase [uncultured Thermanaerothrix sp.]
MSAEAIQKLHALGQSLWYDNIQRRLLEDGELAQMVTEGIIRGVTSNPTIFHQAIAHSNDYDVAIQSMAWAGWSARQIYDQLTIEDIQKAADLFLSLYEASQGEDGYVSLEVAPTLAYDTEGTVAEAKRLWNLVARPNLMIKIPATLPGLPAIRRAIYEGINVNVTLIFSLERYAQVIEAYLSGLEDRLAAGLPVDRIASVASFFISRVDTKVDKRLEEILRREGPEAEQARALMGKAAIANARLAYAQFLEAFGNERFKALARHGAKVQRPLWASTSTKNPAYRDVLYVEELIGPQTVNTVPPQTLAAFADHGIAQVTLSAKVDEEKKIIAALEQLGISMAQVTQELEDEGVRAFASAFEALLKTIEERRQAAVAELGPFSTVLAAQVARVAHEHYIQRLFEADASLWTDDPEGQAEVRRRLGWLIAPQKSRTLLPSLSALALQLVKEGYREAVLLGMGGSSLAPEVFALIFGVGQVGNQPGLRLTVLDTTDPEQIAEVVSRIKWGETLFIVSSKSGTTVEVHALMEYFWEWVKSHGDTTPGRHFIAITDPETPLAKLAYERAFREIIYGDPLVGGRYSALTAFGLVPGALLGMNVAQLLGRAENMMEQCLPNQPAGRNPGLVLGVLLGLAAVQGRDKLTFLADPELFPLGAWLEQLVAESSGKDGRGIIPVDQEPEVAVDGYGQDRLFIYFRLGGAQEARAQALLAAEHPVLTFRFRDVYDLGAEMYRWEVAVAIACAYLRVNAFDQPDVEDSKSRTRALLAGFQSHGVLSVESPQWENGKVGAFTSLQISGDTPSLVDLLRSFIRLAVPGDYVAINAYLPRNEWTMRILQALRKKILEVTGCATTLGFGPRFLHSTGQLHKGGPNRGVFLQITYEPKVDFEIPGQGIRFGILERAQALGDFEALRARGRRILYLHLKDISLEELLDF